MRSQPALVPLVGIASFASLAASDSGAASTAPPPPTQAVATDVTMAIVNKRQSGSFTLRWKPAIDAMGRERRAYDILVTNCAVVRSASGSPLSLAVGGRLHALTGPPYVVGLSGCTCNAAAEVRTAPVPPEVQRSAPAAVARGTIFGAPCR